MTDPALIALVRAVKDSRKGPNVMFTVLCGELAEGDEIALTHADGSSERAHVTDIGKKPLTPESYGESWHRQDGAPESLFRPDDLVLAPDAPPAFAAGEAGGLLDDLAAARAAGRMRITHIPDPIVALYLERRMSDALKESSGAMTRGAKFKAFGDTLEEFGLAEQADRARLLASAIYENYKPGPGMKALAAVGAGLIGAKTSFKTPLTVTGIGMSLENADAFAASYQKGVAFQGEIIRKPMQEEGRAVALGWCKKCRDVRRLDVKFKCGVCRKQAKEGAFRVVVPTDVPVAEAELRAEYGR